MINLAILTILIVIGILAVIWVLISAGVIKKVGLEEKLEELPKPYDIKIKDVNIENFVYNIALPTLRKEFGIKKLDIKKYPLKLGVSDGIATCAYNTKKQTVYIHPEMVEGGSIAEELTHYLRDLRKHEGIKDNDVQEAFGMLGRLILYDKLKGTKYAKLFPKGFDKSISAERVNDVMDWAGSLSAKEKKALEVIRFPIEGGKENSNAFISPPPTADVYKELLPNIKRVKQKPTLANVYTLKATVELYADAMEGKKKQLENFKSELEKPPVSKVGYVKAKKEKLPPGTLERVLYDMIEHKVIHNEEQRKLSRKYLTKHLDNYLKKLGEIVYDLKVNDWGAGMKDLLSKKGTKEEVTQKNPEWIRFSTLYGGVDSIYKRVINEDKLGAKKFAKYILKKVKRDIKSEEGAKKEIEKLRKEFGIEKAESFKASKELRKERVGKEKQKILRDIRRDIRIIRENPKLFREGLKQISEDLRKYGRLALGREKPQPLTITIPDLISFSALTHASGYDLGKNVLWKDVKSGEKSAAELMKMDAPQIRKLYIEKK